MRALVLSNDAQDRDLTLPLPAALRRAGIPHHCVGPTQLIAELTTGACAPLVVIDGDGVGSWLVELLSDVQRRHVAPLAPEVVVFSQTPVDEGAVPWLLAGVGNWLPFARASVLSKYWHWVQRGRWGATASKRSRDELTATTARLVSRLEELLDESCSRDGHLDLWDSELCVRIPVSGGQLGIPEVDEFDSGFQQNLLLEVNIGLPARLQRAGNLPLGADWRSLLVARGCWERAVLRDAFEHRLNAALRWYLGSDTALVRFTPGESAVPRDLLWSATELADGLIQPSRHSHIRALLSPELVVIANDVAAGEPA